MPFCTAELGPNCRNTHVFCFAQFFHTPPEGPEGQRKKVTSQALLWGQLCRLLLAAGVGRTHVMPQERTLAKHEL